MPNCEYWNFVFGYQNRWLYSFQKLIPWNFLYVSPGPFCHFRAMTLVALPYQTNLQPILLKSKDYLGLCIPLSVSLYQLRVETRWFSFSNSFPTLRFSLHCARYRHLHPIAQQFVRLPKAQFFSCMASYSATSSNTATPLPCWVITRGLLVSRTYFKNEAIAVWNSDRGRMSWSILKRCIILLLVK